MGGAVDGGRISGAPHLQSRRTNSLGGGTAQTGMLGEIEFAIKSLAENSRCAQLS